MIQFGIKTGPWEVFGNFKTLKKVWMEAERLGFDSGWLSDHLFDLSGIGPSSTEPCLEAWVTLSSLATLTERLRLGVTCTCNNFRSPSMLAKMSSTLDAISEGRMELALGMGVSKVEHEAYGLPFERFGERAERLREAVVIVKAMWQEESPSFEGRYYSIRGAMNCPKPVQKPPPPIWVGGKNEKYLLKVVAEVSDGWNVISATPEEFVAKLKVIEENCRRFHTDFQRLKRSWQAHLLIGKDESEVEHKLKDFGISNDERRRYEASNAVGTPSQCIEKLSEYVNMGVTHFMLRFPEAPNDLTGMKLFTQEVLPSVR